MSEEKLFNLDIIHQIVGGDKESFIEMIKIFLDTLPAALKKIRVNIENQNWEEVAKIAHSAKSNIDMLEIKSSFYKIKEIEALAKERKNTEKIPELLKKIETEMNTVFEELRQEIK